jgi:GNAT superfamily N-acetyltransferase
MTQIVYADVDGLAVLNEMDDLFPAHYEELCVTKEFDYEPDYDAYKRLAQAGMLRCITCRADGELIGYIIFFISPHLHYKSCITATEDIYFVKKEYRKGRIGIRLFQYAEQVLKERGVQRIVMHTKVHLDNSKLFEYLGYKQTDKVFTKMLGN